MDAFLAGRAPDFQKFRLRDKKELARYVEGYERDENAPPDMRGNGKPAARPRKAATKQRTTGRIGKQARARA
jgi:hypothetical protein